MVPVLVRYGTLFLVFDTIVLIALPVHSTTQSGSYYAMQDYSITAATVRTVPVLYCTVVATYRTLQLQ